MSNAPDFLSEAVWIHYFRSRSFHDFSWVSSNGVGTDTLWTGNGLAFDGITSNVVSPAVNFSTTYGTIILGVDLDDWTLSGKTLFNCETAANVNEIKIYTSASTIVAIYRKTFGAETYTVSYDVTGVSGEHYIGFSWDLNSNSIKLFFDGLEVDSAAATAEMTSFASNGTLFSDDGGGNNAKGRCLYQVATDTFLTATEHSDLFVYLSDLYFPTETSIVSNANFYVGYDPSLVAGFNMIPEGDQLIDQSQYGNNGIIHGASYESTLLGDALVFDGVDDIVSSTTPISAVTIAGSYTITGWFKAKSTPDSVIFGNLIGSSDRCSIKITGALRANVFNGSSWDALSSDEVIQPGLIYHFAMTRTGGASKLYLNNLEQSGTDPGSTAGGAVGWWSGDDNSSFGKPFDGFIYEIKVFDEAKDQAWITKEYNKGKNALWQTASGVNESIVAITSENLENSDVEVISGSFKMITDTRDTKVTKIIENVSSGICVIPTRIFKQTQEEAAKGRFEFTVNIKTGNFPLIYFIANSVSPTATDGYGIEYTSNGAVRLRRRTSGVTLFLSVDSTYTYDVDQKWTIDVNGDTFAVYLDNVLVSTASGSNPVTDSSTITTSTHFVFQLGSGDEALYASMEDGSNSIIKGLLS